MKTLEPFLKDMTFNSHYRFLDYGKETDKQEITEVAAKRGIKLPAKDLAIFKCTYAFVDRQNLNGCTLPKEEVEKALDTLVGKAVDFDHERRTVVGHWIDAELVDNQIVGYGVFYKGNFQEDYELIKEMMESDVLAISFEAYGEREGTLESYTLKNIEFAGGALLIKTKPAFPGSEVTEMAKRKERVLEFASVMTEPKEYLHESVIGEKSQKKEEPKEKAEEYQCECIKCGFTTKTTEHCKDITCPECGGQMRRKERPGPGQGEKEKSGGQSMNLEEKVKELEQEIASLKEQISKKDEELAKVTEDLEKSTSTIEELKKESEEAKVKIEEVEKAKAEEVEKAKKDATMVAERRNELGEFAEEMSDEDILDDDKFELAKTRKELAEKDARLKELEETAGTTENASYEKGSRKKDKKDPIAESKARVDKMAWEFDEE